MIENRQARRALAPAQAQELAAERRAASIGIGRTHARTRVILRAPDLNVRMVDAVTGDYSGN
ncbi:MAG TPA: hypothetical protein VFT75_04995 [Nocardioidaceae bacterium]|jgi:hypothetical protein|nr:hypothetical protein [Nocardioidaceae bacterium]